MPDGPDIDRLKARLADRVRTLRAERAWSQEKLASEARIHRTHVGFIERAERTPGIDVLAKVAHALGITLASLVEGIDAGS